MQRKNFLIFLVAFGVFLAVLVWVQPMLFPPVTVPKEPEKEKPLTPAQKQIAALAGVLGGYLAGPEVTKAAKAPPPDEQFARRPPVWKQLGLALGFAWPASGAELPQRKARGLIKVGQDEPDSDYHLYALLDPRGACVRELILNKFPSANDEGRPGKSPVLELVPRDDRLGSYLLYHYDPDQPRKERPLDTLGRIDWTVAEKSTAEDGTQRVVFATEIQGFAVTKTFTLAPRQYHLGLEVQVRRTERAKKDVKFRYQLMGAHGLPIEGKWYTATFRQSLIATTEGNDLWRDLQDLRAISIKEGGEEVTGTQNKMIQYAAVAVQYFACVIVVDDDQEKRDFLASARPTLEARAVRVELEEPLGTGPLEVRDKNDPKKIKPMVIDLDPEVADGLRRNGWTRKGAKFGLLVVPETDDSFRAIGLMSDAQTQPLFQDDITVRVNTEAFDVEGPVTHKYLLYNGPVKPMLLGQFSGQRAVDPALVERYVHTLRLNTLTDYHSPGWLGSFASSIYWTDLVVFFTNLMHRVLFWLHNVVPSYGLCIVLLTVLVRGMLFPLSKRQAMTGMKMQELAPELKKIQVKFKDDPQQRTAAMMALYRQHGVNPLGSCWLLLMQLPIFMGLYYCLQESVHFRLAPFLWMDNLAAPDMLIRWGEGIPWISRPEDYGSLIYLGPFFNVLPILAVTLMLMQQKMMMPPAQDEQQAMQQKMMKWMMILFALFFYRVASGLCLYFIASTVWGFCERKLLPKKKPATDGAISTDAMLERMAPPAQPAPTAASDKVTTAGGTRAQRRQERKRKQSQYQAKGQPAAAPPPPPRDGYGEQTGGWFAGLRRWWRDIVEKARKKGQHE